ncbi:exopolysaccharide biosynthesis protein [Rhizobium sp. Leaf384]|uniref:polysaccharide biosynthesis/export family protein n=1 Tax=unclassified Rhizobium TaxID=2613769 RepID=UPI00071241C0|nr:MULTISPECIES: polysaccharide biosynthesis/export family protein [unclassified Rhizobium]KQS76654.1 exopolysaccharide biosynthesis protein [Rhizobium sp. Leaf383]KQS77922.1 exopolysaccharide biosynthesis protein [Rhizobium sp. Leaf384]
MQVDLRSRLPVPKARLKPMLHAAVVFWTVVLTGAAPAQAAGVHRVMAGDVLMIWVYGDTGLTGAFPVGEDGMIGYPILGNIPVADKTTVEIGDALGKALAEHVPNLSVAVTVKEYAPVFIVGEIQKPGKYEFRPGMIALELFALGGGLRDVATRTDVSGVQLIAAQQDYEDMALQLLGMEVKQSRLEAELNDTPFDEKAISLSGRDPLVVQQMAHAEAGIFNLRLAALKNERDNLEIQSRNYAEEIETLTKTGALRNQQFELLRQDVDAAQELVTKGASTQSALRERKRDLLAMNQQLLEFGSYLARAQQNKNEVERRIAELSSIRHNTAATELRDIRLEILRLRQKMTFSGQTMAEIGLTAKRVNAIEDTVETAFALVRLVNGAYQETAIDEHTALQSGDVIRVRLVAHRPGARSAASPTRQALR